MNDKNLVILHVSERIKGGTASYLNEVLEYQSDKFGTENIHALLPESQVNGLTNPAKICLHIFKDGSSRVLDAFRLSLKFHQLVKKYDFDIVHIHGTFAGFAVRLLLGWKKQRPKLVYCAHGWAFDRETSAWKNWIIGFIEKLLSYLTDRIICISQHEYRSALRVGIPKEKTVTIINAISREYESEGSVDWPSGKRRFLFAGRFDQQKGMDVFVEAMRKIGSKGFAYAIGEATESDKVTHKLPENIKITGWLPRNVVQAYFESCDVFVIPSRWEGVPISALEALRAGRALIASRVGGLPELVEDGVNGILVNKNSVDELVAAMQKISDQDVVAMGNASRQRFESFFTSERLNLALIDLYRKVLD